MIESKQPCPMCKSLPVLETMFGLVFRVKCDCSEGGGATPQDAFAAWMADVDMCGGHVQNLVKGLRP